MCCRLVRQKVIRSSAQLAAAEPVHPSGHSESLAGALRGVLEQHNCAASMLVPSHGAGLLETGGYSTFKSPPQN